MLANFLNSQSTANKEKEAQWSTVERDDEKKTHTQEVTNLQNH